MLEKRKKYTYEEIKEIFEQAELEAIMNPFGEVQEKENDKLSGQMQFMTMMVAIPTVHTLKEKLFGKEEK